MNTIGAGREPLPLAGALRDVWGVGPAWESA
jgi:hypothetical protein